MSIAITIDHGAIADNIRALRARAAGAQVMGVVKADAYGHGLIEAGRAAREGGAAWLGTAQPTEALALREAGDEGRILTWLYGPDGPFDRLIPAGIDLSVGSLKVLEAIAAAARATGEAPRLHVFVDTGLGREGCPIDLLPALLDRAKELQDAGTVSVVGMWSHLAWADRPGHPTIDRQAAVFATALDMAAERALTLEVRHLANSAATLTRPDLHFDLVRPGIAMYGCPPVEDPDGALWGLRPAMAVTTRLALVKPVHAGQGVSYGHEYTTDRETVLGLVPVGYADGVFRSCGGGRAEVAVRGSRYPIAGRVCMDQFVIDLGPDTEATEGDEVILFGPDGPTAQEWAAAAGTIDYEILCRFGGLRPKGEA
ncbi:alanine racemase [Demequina zhanjiangensis]|uniref:Alanine racemase n=1 Tax=Demequina zhanjiangensis TaxID=3051659 RepID=A0ABT8FXB6_9MICO|nr:alanine racemase [Demequina sp. SYSU T00b26]MDN4471548.1 alanine racemase [Demequina sp. SYSU T00b26]